MANSRSAAQIHIGSYAKAGGRGLYPATLSATGEFDCGEPFAAAANASFAASVADRYYIVDEAAGTIGVFRRVDEHWQEEHRFASGGEQPCYLAVDATGSVLAVANYGDGSVAVWRLDERGMPEELPAVRQSHGSGPVTERQEGPHCHCAVFDPARPMLYVTDLGADAIRALSLAGNSVGTLQTAHHAPPGSGPRHLLFANDRLAVLVSELGSLLTTFNATGGEWRPIDSRSTLPPDFAGKSVGGHLVLNRDGRRAYASNRGHDSIAGFSVDDTGRIELLEHVASGGSSPRHILVLEDLALLVVAHEEDGTVVSFRIAEDGRLAATGHSTTVPGSCFVLRTG